MAIEVIGYSERGIVNALFYDLEHAPHEDGAFPLLTLCQFPLWRGPQNQIPGQSRVDHATVLVEQSFSGFGDADALVLLDRKDGRKQAIFIEAKVKTAQQNNWAIQDYWFEFLRLLNANLGGPNLFVQLYRKLRLAYQLTHPDEPLVAADIPGAWSLGANPVVWRAAEMLRPYAKDVWYLALVPDKPQNTDAFFRNQLAGFNPAQEEFNLPQWDVTQWGYLTWVDINDLVQADLALWQCTRRSFEHNRAQIFGHGIGHEAHHVAVPNREDLDAFLQERTELQIAFFRAMAGNGGQQTQAQLLEELNLLPAQLRRVKSGINLASDRLHFERLIGPTDGGGPTAVHNLTSIPQLRERLIAAINDLA